MQIDIPRLVIAAPSSGSGKSTITTGLMTALARDYPVQGFKVGPDYIDPGYHTAATGRISRNLDTWMVPASRVIGSFARAAQGAEIAIVEGVMGLYDGFNASSEEGSTAQLAKLLKAPVVLVIDVGKMARSAGAMALGYRQYDPELNLAGAICNRVGSAQHARLVTEAIETLGIPVLGCIPKSAELKIPERHLGLYMAQERTQEVEKFIQHCAVLFNENVNLDMVWELACIAEPFEWEPELRKKPAIPSCQIAVARDDAFCFYYEDNVDLLRQAGAEIVFFSPLHDSSLPPNCAGIYLGGGYPELYAAQLAENRAIRNEIVKAVTGGMPIYAECGGLMTLTEYLIDLDGKRHEMVGLVPGHAQMVEQLVMGYREVTAMCDSPILDKGEVARGHEFHYSNWVQPRGMERSSAYRIKPRVGEGSVSEGYINGNILASYVHIHFASNLDIAQNFVTHCQRWKSK